MADLLLSRPGRIEDLPRRPQKQGPLSETEDEEAVDAADGGASGSGEPPDPLKQAVVELTKIAKTLVPKKAEAKTDLENLLSGSLADRGDTSSGGGSRRNSAALAALKRLLKEQPAAIYENIERNLREDFGLRAQVAGEPSGHGTARAWLQTRSRVQNYTNHVRWLWQLSAVWDCLMQGQNEEARARVALLMAAGEQSSIDSGNWLISTVALLEPPPPYQQFSHHTTPAAHECQHSALYDPRWFELFLWQLKEHESYLEARRKLTQRKPGPTVDPGSDAAAQRGPKAKQKPKGPHSEE
ncbi:unnamed protein product [Symbiodinium sp. CCMP2592]|nr:unnamed protein product [Symbiodinium sp. CCMP2592]